jgi:hypothetical protein
MRSNSDERTRFDHSTSVLVVLESASPCAAGATQRPALFARFWLALGPDVLEFR